MFGPWPTVTDPIEWSQPAVTVALHVVPSITETVPSLPFATYTVWRARSMASPIGPAPTGTTGAARRHPDVCRALQVIASITDTVPSALFAT